MNNKPTPRTDAVMQDPLRDGNDLPELARQLENELSEALRERDEAREERDQFRSLNESYAACWDEIRAALGESEQGDKTCDLDRVLKAIRERDDYKWQLHIATGAFEQARQMERAWRKEETNDDHE